MSIRRLPNKPDLEHLKNQAKALQRGVQRAEPEALSLVQALHPRPPETMQHADALLVIARSYGFSSWPALRKHVETTLRYSRSPHAIPSGDHSPEDTFLRLAVLAYGGDHSDKRTRARAMLASHPEIAHASIYTLAVVGEIEAVRARLTDNPSLANLRGGPHDWEPLLYLTYSRLPSTTPPGNACAIANILLSAGADPNPGFLWEGNTPPFTALTGAFGGGEDAVNQPPHPEAHALTRLLLSAGADPNDEQTLYNRQFERDDAHLVLLLSSGLGRGAGGTWHRRLAMNSPRQMLEDQLLFAAIYGYDDRVELLLRHGVAPDGTGSGHPMTAGHSALALARKNGNTRVAERLLAAGARPIVTDTVDELLVACMAGDRARVAEILAADPASASRAKARAPGSLIAAAARGRAEAVMLFISTGFDIDFVARTTALHEAASRGDSALVELLLQRGADPTIRDTAFAATAAGWAEHQGHRVLAEMLREHEARHSSPERHGP